MSSKSSPKAAPSVEKHNTAPASRAEAMQAQTMTPPQNEGTLPTTLRARNSYEYHLDLPRSVVLAILDPDVPDAFIEVPCGVRGARRFLHTSEIKEIDVKGF